MHNKPTPPNVVGMHLDSAVELAEKEGWKFRVTKFNGNYKVVTMDFRSDRINVEVESNIVINQRIA